MKKEIEKQIHQFAEIMYKTGYEDGQAWVDGKMYTKGLNNAWECAKKIRHMDIPTLNKVFDDLRHGIQEKGHEAVFENYEPFKAIAKIKEYEEIKEYDEQKNEIHVGDEVVSDAFDEKGIVTHINDKSCVSLICDMNSMINTSLDKVHKTGKSYPQIVEILEQLKGDKE